MATIHAKDRVSLCSFTFSDGRRCRTPRIGKHPHFCFHHAQKEARARTAETLGKELAYFFSGKYLSACDLSTALGRLIPAVVRGDVKPKTAHTVAYMAQTLMQAIHLSKHEYINAFGSDGWRNSIRNSVNSNHDYLFPPDPHRSRGLQAGPAPQPEHPGQPQPQPAPPPPAATPNFSAKATPPQPAPSPHTPMPPTSTEFVQQVIARLQTGGGQAPQPSQAPQTPASPSHPNHPVSTTPKTPPIPATQPVRPVVPAVQPNNPPQPRPSTPRPEPDRSAPWLHFGDTRIPPDSKLL